jgi:hypothetical protein
MRHSIGPIPPARYPSIPDKRVILFHNPMSEIVPDTIILFSVGDGRFVFRILLQQRLEARIGADRVPHRVEP